MNEKSIFAAALEIEGTCERQAFLDGACAENHELRAQVEELLQASSQAGSFLDQPLAGVEAATATFADIDCPTTAETSIRTLLSPCDKPDRLGTLDKYEIIEVVGHGGMGTVLRAFDTKLSRVVALKVMTPELAANPTAVRRFLREATTAAAVVHDHVVTIYAVDDTHRPPFLVMEFVEGQTLQQKIQREGALELKTILRIGSQAAAGLAAAHKTGLIHRDVKPANILLENGIERVKITDFGLARAADDIEMTKAGMIAGTPQYMSPEQAKGESIDIRSDLFSLGSVLYTMCTGRPAFRAETTMGVLKRVCEDEPRPIHEVNPEIPDWLEAIVGKLLSKNPDERIQSAVEIAELLNQHQAHLQQPTLIPQPPAIAISRSKSPSLQVASGVRPSVLHSRWWQITAAAAVLLCVGLALAESTGVTSVAATVIRIVRGDGTLVVEVDDPNIQVLLDGDEIAITGAGPKELRLRPGQHQLQSVKDGKPVETKLVTITKGGRDVVKVTREQASTTPIAPTTRLIWDKLVDDVSPDGRYLAFTDFDTGDLAIRDLATGQDRRLTNKGTWEQSSAMALLPRFSQDGKFIAFAWGDQGVWDLRTIARDGGEPRVIRREEKVYFDPYGWTEDNRAIVVGTYSSSGGKLWKDISVISIDDGSKRLLKSLDVALGNLVLFGRGLAEAVAPDGRYLAYSRPADSGADRRSIFLIDMQSGKERTLGSRTGSADVLAWSPDSRHLLFTIERQGTKDAWLTEIVDGGPQGTPQLVKTNFGDTQPLRITTNGTFVYGTKDRPNDANARGIFTATLDLENGKATALPLATERFSIRDQFYGPHWSKDGERLLYVTTVPGAAQEIRILTAKTGDMQVLKSEFPLITSACWHPDGHSIFAVCREEQKNNGSTICQIDIATQKLTRLVETKDAGVYRVRATSDGRGIIYNKRTIKTDTEPPTSAVIYRDLTTNAEREIIPRRTDYSVQRFEVSPDGRQLAMFVKKEASGSEILEVFDMESGSTRELYHLPAPSDQKANQSVTQSAIDWSADGRYVLFAQSARDLKECGLWYVPRDGGRPRKLDISGFGEREIQQFATHPDGKQVAFTASAPPRKYEVWALENFLPPFDEPKPAAATAAAPSGTSPAVPTTRQIWASAPDSNGTVSPDGRYVAVTDWPTGDIAIRDLTINSTRRLTGRGWNESEYGTDPAFSPDSKQIAYAWLKNHAWNLRVSSLDGSDTRTLFPHNDAEAGYAYPLDWSPDGKELLCIISTDKPRAAKLAFVSVAAGATRVVQDDVKWYWKKDVRLSPDGRYIAYSHRPSQNQRKQDIFLVSTADASETTLVQHAADDILLAWTPDSGGLLFKSDRAGETGLWLQRIKDGHPRGAPLSLRSQLGHVRGMRLSRSGSFFYGVHAGGENVYTAQIDLAAGKLLTQPAEPLQKNIGSNWSPAWSPDGRHLACITTGPQLGFLIRNVGSGEVRELSTNLTGFNYRALAWSPDSKVLFIGGPSRRIDIETGAVSKFATDANGDDIIRYHPQMAPDGKFVIHLTVGADQRVFRYDIDSDVNEEIYKPQSRMRSCNLSPDGSQIALAEGNSVKIMPSTGRDARELAAGEKPVMALDWTPDGKRILFARTTGEGASPVGAPADLWLLTIATGELQEVADNLPAVDHLRIHPDGNQIAFCAYSPNDEKHEIWALENFLPPRMEPKAEASSNDLPVRR